MADGDAWFERFGYQLAAAGQRVLPRARREAWEAICALQLPLHESGPIRLRRHPALLAPGVFFDRLVSAAAERRPEVRFGAPLMP